MRPKHWPYCWAVTWIEPAAAKKCCTIWSEPAIIRTIIVFNKRSGPPMQRTELVSLYTATPADGTKVTVCGWAKTVRDSKNIGFISLSDGSCYMPVQIAFQADKLSNYAEVAKCGLYTSFEVAGTLVLTPSAKQPFEINADTITVLGTCGPEYPLQKKKMGMDYLRTMTHLRPRTNTFNAAFRVRGQAAFAIHQFFHERGFTYVHTPIFTGSDCEGAGEMF